MSVVITIDDIRAYAEVDYIINHMNQKYIDKVPQRMKEFFSSLKDPNYVVKINPYVPLQNQGLQRYTLEIIALLHLKYWCEDEERKKELYDIMLKNQRRLEEQMREKYGVEKLFDNASAKVISNENDLNNSTNQNDNDFSRPRVVQRYTGYEQNNDIQDYTDHVETTNNQTANYSQESNSLVKNTATKIGFIAKIKEKLQSIFKRV